MLRQSVQGAHERATDHWPVQLVERAVVKVSIAPVCLILDGTVRVVLATLCRTAQWSRLVLVGTMRAESPR